MSKRLKEKKVAGSSQQRFTKDKSCLICLFPMRDKGRAVLFNLTAKMVSIVLKHYIRDDYERERKNWLSHQAFMFFFSPFLCEERYIVQPVAFTS